MRILITTPMPPQLQPTNAVPLVTYAQLVGLAARHDVTVATLAGPDPAEWEAVDQLRAQGFDVRAIRRTRLRGVPRWRRGVRLVGAALYGGQPFRSAWYWDARLQALLDRLLSEGSFDLVTAEDNAMGAYQYRTTRPLILTEMEVRRPRPIAWRREPTMSWAGWAFNELDWRRWPGYQRAVWRRFDRLQVFTQHDADALRDIAPDLADRVRITPFGIPLPPPADPAAEQADTVVFVGGFSHYPNVDAALWLGQAIMPLLRARRPGVRLLLVGSYPPAAVRDLASDDIAVTGRVPDVDPYLSRAAVVVAPLRIGGGMRMKVLQGMALGKAVVTTPRGAEGLALAGAPLPVVLASDTQALAEGIISLLESPGRRQALGQAARAFAAQHYSADAYARRLEATYEEVAATAPTRPQAEKVLYRV